MSAKDRTPALQTRRCSAWDPTLRDAQAARVLVAQSRPRQPGAEPATWGYQPSHRSARQVLSAPVRIRECRNCEPQMPRSLWDRRLLRSAPTPLPTAGAAHADLMQSQCVTVRPTATPRTPRLHRWPDQQAPAQQNAGLFFVDALSAADRG